MSLRQVQVLGGGLEIVVPQQDLDCAQVGACFQQVGGPTVTQRMRSNPFAEARSTRSFATCDPDGLIRNGLIQPAAKSACGKQVELWFAPPPVLSQGFE